MQNRIPSRTPSRRGIDKRNVRDAPLSLESLRAASPKIRGYHSPDQGESDAKFSEDVFRTDEAVARSVQDNGGPSTTRPQRQPRQDEGETDHVGEDNGQIIPAGSHVVAGKDDDGHMPRLANSGTRNPRQPIFSPRVVAQFWTTPGRCENQEIDSDTEGSG